MSEKNIRDFYKKEVTGLTATEFELLCKDILTAYAEEENLKNFQIKHNVRIPEVDGTFQIDIFAEFYALKTQFKVLVECKQYKNTVPRERIEILNSRLQSTGSQKGILMSTAGFQSGALQYAKEHGIALIQVFNTNELFHSYSSHENEKNDYNNMLLRYPVYSADDVTEGKRMYPNSRMIQEIMNEIQEES